MTEQIAKKRGRPRKIPEAQKHVHKNEDIKTKQLRKTRQAFGKEVIKLAKEKFGEEGLSSDAQHIYCAPVYTNELPKMRLPHTEFTEEHLKSIEDAIAAGGRPSTVATLHSVAYVTLQQNYQHVIDQGLARYEIALSETLNNMAKNGSEAIAVYLDKSRCKNMEYYHRERLDLVQKHHEEKMQLERERLEAEKNKTPPNLVVKWANE